MRSDSKITITIVLKTTRESLLWVPHMACSWSAYSLKKSRKGKQSALCFSTTQSLLLYHPCINHEKSQLKWGRRICYLDASLWRSRRVLWLGRCGLFRLVLAWFWHKLLCPSRGLGCLRLCPFGLWECLAPGICLCWCVHFKTRRWKLVVNMLVGSSCSSMLVHPAPERSHKCLSRALAGLVWCHSSGGT